MWWHLQPVPRSPSCAHWTSRYTPLHLAAKFNYPELVEQAPAPARPATLFTRGCCNPTPEAATLCTQVEFLLQHGARTDMLTRDEKTARHPAGRAATLCATACDPVCYSLQPCVLQPATHAAATCTQARDLAVPKQERSHEQMGDMLALFDRYDAQAKHRKRLLPGAPLPPDPRLAAAGQGGYTADAAPTHGDPPGYHPAHRASPSSFAPLAVAPRADAAVAPSMASMHLCPPAAMRLRPSDAYASAHAHQHVAAPGAGYGGSEPAAAAAARSSRSLLSRPDAPPARGLSAHTALQQHSAWPGPAPTPPDTGSSLRPDQVADVQYLASRARGRLGSGPLW